MSGAVWAVLIGAVLAYLLSKQGSVSPATPSGTSVSVTLPPVTLTSGSSNSDVQALLGSLVPSIVPTTNPPGWSVVWPSVQLPSDFGGVAFQLPPTQLPLVPLEQAKALASALKPQVVTTPDGIGVQITSTITS